LQNPNIKSLSAASCPLTNNSLALVAENLLKIEYLTIDYCEKVDDIVVMQKCENLKVLNCATQALSAGKATLFRVACPKVQVGNPAAIYKDKSEFDFFTN
jgi:hypothetical protein